MKNTMLLILVTISLPMLFASCGEDGKSGEDGSSCTIVENEAGSTTLVCDDGTEVEIVSGDKGDPGDDGKDGEKGDPGEDGEDGEDGEKGDLGEDGQDGAQALVITTELSSDPEDDSYDENCPYGGVKIESGIDDGEGNFVDEPVVTYICNGEDGEKGDPGATGDPGAVGDPGADGEDGADGADGECAGNNPPVINSININGVDYTGTPVQVVTHEDFNVIINATDADSDPLTYSISGGSFDITVNGSGDYTFSGDTEGLFHFSVIVSDGCQVTVNDFAIRKIPIKYSGANRNIVYSELQFNETISLFDAEGTWDDMRLSLHVHEDPANGFQYSFSNLLNVHGNYVEFAVGSYINDMKKFSHLEEIGSSLTYSGNSYKYFSNYYEDVVNSVMIENGEFRNTTGYAGLKFTDGDYVYYGWIQVSVTNYDNSNITGTLIDWAYNTIPGEPIPAGYTGE